MREDIALWLHQKLKDDEADVKEMKAYDNIANMKWDLPAGLARLTYSVKYVDPIGHDAEKTATNFFDTYQPKIDILPNGPDDVDTAEELERFVEWHMMRANLHGDKEPFRELLVQSIRYNRVCAQLDYLPYRLPKDKSKWTDEQREAVADSPFCIYVHNPQNVRFEMGPYGLRKIAVVSNMLVSSVIAHWGIYPDANVTDLMIWVSRDPQARVVYVDYTDAKERYVECFLVGAGETAYPVDMFGLGTSPVPSTTVYTKKNELGFINWVVATGSSDALFAAIHRGDLWVNANRAESIKQSAIYRRAFYPLAIEEGQGTEDTVIDYSGDQPVYKVPMGKKLTPINPPAMDPAWSQLAAEARSVMASATGVQSLGGIEPKSNVQFATLNMFVQLSMTALIPYIRTVEKVIGGLCRMVFKWLRAADVTEVGRRAYAKGDGKPKGMKIMVGPGDFDPESLFITVKLVEDTPTGKLQLVNMITQLKQANIPIPSAELIEKLGYGHPEALKGEWEKEQVEQIALQGFAEEQSMARQMKMQQFQMQQQAQMQQQQNPQQPTIPQGQANNPAAGGNSPAESAPDLTQTQLPQEPR